MTAMLPQFVCPECRRALAIPDPETACPGGCGVFTRDGGVFRLLAPARQEVVAPFLAQYRVVRAREGYRTGTPHYYRALPHVMPGDRHADQWQIRRRSFRTLLREVFAATVEHPLRVLDVGAGNGWLSHQIASLGHWAVAVDLLDDEADGLGACRYYPAPITAVQADFDRLPFAPGQFDCVVFNGALHYARDVAATLLHASEMLAADGALVVADSPLFERVTDGRAMLAEKRQSFARDHGITDVVEPGAGFLTFAQLERATLAAGFHGEFFKSRGPLGWRLRREIGRYRLGRAPAAFGVWVAR